jgi:hypothetical protein
MNFPFFAQDVIALTVEWSTSGNDIIRADHQACARTAIRKKDDPRQTNNA